MFYEGGERSPNSVQGSPSLLVVRNFVSMILFGKAARNLSTFENHTLSVVCTKCEVN